MKATTIEQCQQLEHIPNIGPALAADLRLIGLSTPTALIGQDPYAMMARLETVTGQRQDPCVLDSFIAATRFMAGDPPRPWWHYTPERKRALARAATGSASPSDGLAGLGPASRAMLAQAGIRSLAQLRELGAVRAYHLTRQASPKASLNLLWALEGVLSNRSWQVVARTDRLSLLLQLEALGPIRHPSPR